MLFEKKKYIALVQGANRHSGSRGFKLQHISNGDCAYTLLKYAMIVAKQRVKLLRLLFDTILNRQKYPTS